MNVATPTDETSATLSDVLAFIDSCESSDSEPSLDESVSSDGDSGSPLLFDGPTPNQPTGGLATGQGNTQHEQQAKTKQPRGAHVPQSTKFQREKKREMLELRQQVAELNARLLHLQRTRRDLGTLDTGRGTVDLSWQRRGVVSVWEDLAAVQNQERQRAERTNKELKTILARQRKVSHSFRKLLRKKNMLDGMAFLCELQPLPNRPQPMTDSFLLSVDISDSVLSELEAAVATLYLQSDSVIPPLEGQPAASCLTQDKRGEPLGTYMETTTVTPMACPIQKASQILWECTTQRSQDPEKVPQFVRARCLNSLARSCKLQLRNTVPIKGLNFVRKYEDADRIVLVSTATWFLPADGLQFQDQVWTIVTRSPIDPLNASVVQTFCQFGAKCPGKGSTRAEDFVRSQDYVLDSVGRKLRQLQELQQKCLLEQVQLATTIPSMAA